MPIAREGLREIAILTVALGGGGASAAWAALTVSPWWWLLAIPMLGLWLFGIVFFRDPARTIPTEPGLIVAPADGKVTEVVELDACGGIDGPACKIGIFLSIFDVHINRSPCAGRVVSSQYQPGEFLDARHPESGIRNEANTLTIDAGAGIGNVVVRQVADLVARRIICHLKPGDTVERGQRFGLIKFGSRTELIVARSAGFQPAVRIGDRVAGGISVLMRQVKTPETTTGGPALEDTTPAPAAASQGSRP